jgi:hypothetical protein
VIDLHINKCLISLKMEISFNLLSVGYSVVSSMQGNWNISVAADDDMRCCYCLDALLVTAQLGIVFVCLVCMIDIELCCCPDFLNSLKPQVTSILKRLGLFYLLTSMTRLFFTFLNLGINFSYLDCRHCPSVILYYGRYLLHLFASTSRTQIPE